MAVEFPLWTTTEILCLKWRRVRGSVLMLTAAKFFNEGFCLRTKYSKGLHGLRDEMVIMLQMGILSVLPSFSLLCYRSSLPC